MLENQRGSDDLLHSADCIEAFIVFKRHKNLLFMILVMCLLSLQASFYLVDRGYVKVNSYTYGDDMDAEPTKSAASGGSVASDELTALVESDTRAELNGPIETSGSEHANRLSGLSALAAKWLPAEFLRRTMIERLVSATNLINAVLILAATLYCLTLLSTLKVSIHGRLGGVSHIARAFFLSLLMVVLLLPWQKVVGSGIIGVVFTPDEMLKWHSAKTDDMLDLVLYYLRFSGAGILILLLLILSQLRSLRWVKTALYRFGAI